MNIVDDTDGPLDPRIQIELENLNNATDDINKLEIELDEANTAFGHLVSESTSRLKELMNKLGSNCIDKARCYYEACEVAHQARLKCQQQAQLYQRANVVHTAAKETVAIAESRFMSHQHEWNFDQAWQDSLNHATLKVTETENQKAECAREHQRRTVLFHEAEKKVQQLEEKYRRSINKAKPYFELKAECDQKLSIQKEVVDCLKKAVKDAKCSYAASLRALEEISNQIHEKRRDYDIVVNGPREPGVGAELVTPDESLNYQDELNKVRISRVNSIASSDQDIDDRNQDFEDVKDLRKRVDHLSVRSVDGSESSSSQWELELQASVEKLNNLPSQTCGSEKTDCVNSTNIKTVEVVKCSKDDDKTSKEGQSDRRKQFDIIQGWQSLTQTPINSFINRSKIALKNSLSKSLSNSPVSMGSFSFGKPKVSESQTTSEEFNSCNAIDERLHQSCEKEFSDHSIVDKNIDQISCFEDQKNFNYKNNGDSDKTVDLTSKNESQLRPSHLSFNDTQVQNTSKTTHSLDSSPVKIKSLSSSTFTSSLINGLNTKVKKAQNDIQTDCCSSSKTKELPLLSFFQKSTVLMPPKDKSCSMINLNEKQNLKTLLDNSDLGNIQAVSIEKLANARHKLVGDS